MHNEYLVFVQYADGGETRLMQVFNDEASAREYVRYQRQKEAAKKNGAWSNTYYAAKRLS
jgi:hypothetical protein